MKVRKVYDLDFQVHGCYDYIKNEISINYTVPLPLTDIMITYMHELSHYVFTKLSILDDTDVWQNLLDYLIGFNYEGEYHNPNIYNFFRLLRGYFKPSLHQLAYEANETEHAFGILISNRLKED
jgi:hypothetical protein